MYKIVGRNIGFISSIFLFGLIVYLLFPFYFINYVWIAVILALMLKFRVFKNNNRLDVIFVFIIVCLLSIPISHISNADKSMQENRLLAKLPPLFVSGYFNLESTGQFDEWFNDRFSGRGTLITLYNSFHRFHSVEETARVLVGKNGWMFYRGNSSYANFANRVTLSEENMANGLEYLQAIDTWCRENGKEFYYIIAPDKNKIYGEYYRFVKKVAPDSHGIGYQFINYIKEHSDIKAAYLRDDILAHKNEGLLYYKDDTHWNWLGAYYGYKSLMKLMGREPIEVSFVMEDWHEQGDLSNMYRSVEKPAYYDKPRLEKNNKCIDEEYIKGVDKDTILTCVNQEKDMSIFMIRDSFARLLIPYLSQTFRESVFYVSHGITKGNLDYIKQNSDIVILENVERFIPNILEQKFPKD